MEKSKRKSGLEQSYKNCVSSIETLINSYARKDAESIEIRHNLEEKKFGIIIGGAQLNNYDIETIKRLATNDSPDQVKQNEFYKILESLAKNFVDVTVKFKKDLNTHCNLHIKNREIFKFEDIDNTSSGFENKLIIVLIAENELKEPFLIILKDTVARLAVIYYKTLFRLNDINLESVDWETHGVNNMALQVSRVKGIKYHNIYHEIVNNSKFSMEICLFVHSFLDQSSKSCERHILFNGEFNEELSQHLLSHLGIQLENINFYAIITSQELNIKPMKTHLFEFSVDILSFLQENQKKTLQKDSIHFEKEKEEKPPEQGRRLRSRDVVIVEDEEIDLTKESKNLKNQEDNFLEIDQNNEDCFFKLVCSGCFSSNFTCDTDRIFQWLETVSPLHKPEGVVEILDSDLPTISNPNPVPALTQNPVGDSDILEIKDTPEVVVPKKKPPVYKNEGKTRPLPDIFKKRIDNNMKVINENAKKTSTSEMLRNGKIKSNLFSTSELKHYGNKINSAPWRREKTPPTTTDVIILDSPDEDKVQKSKPFINGYKIPKLKHSVEKQADVYNGECSRSSKYEANLIPIERISTNHQAGTSAQGAKSPIASLCQEISQIEDPGLGNILGNFDFLTKQERSYYESNNNRTLESSRKKFGETSRSISSKDDDLFDWNDQPTKSGGIFSTIKDRVSGFFANSANNSVNHSITSSKDVDSLMNSLSKNDDEVSFVGYGPPSSSSSTSKFISFPSTSTPQRNTTTLPNGEKPYGIFTSKNNRANNQPEYVDSPKRKKGNDDNDVVEVIEVQDNSDHEGSKNDSRSERHRRRENRNYRESSERHHRSSRDRSRSRSRERYDRNRDRDRRTFYHHDDRRDRSPPRYSSRYHK